MILQWYGRLVIHAALITPKSITISFHHRFTIKVSFIPPAIKGIDQFYVYFACKICILKSIELIFKIYYNLQKTMHLKRL